MVGSLLLYFTIAFVCAGLGVLLTRRGRKRRQIYSLLRQQGVLVKGHITQRETGVVGRGTTWYYLTYSYQYNGKSYVHMQPVWRNYYIPRDIGTEVAVSCLSQNPAVAALLEDEFEATAKVFSVLGGWVLIGLAIFVVVITIASLFLPHGQ